MSFSVSFPRIRFIREFGLVKKIGVIGLMIALVFSGASAFMFADERPFGVRAAADQDCDTTVSGGTAIQDAVDAAEDGDTICVGSGTHNGMIVIDKPGLTLRGLGEGTDRPILSRMSAEPLSGFQVEADDVTIENFRIRDYDVAGVRVMDESDNVEVRDTWFWRNEVGVLVEEAEGSLIEQNYMERNSVAVKMDGSAGFTVDDNEIFGSTGSLRAFEIVGTTDGLVSNNTVEHVSGIEATVLVSGATGLVYKNNTHMTNREGIRVHDSTDITFQGNDITGQSGSNRVVPGFWVTGGSGTVIDDNVVSESNFGVDVVLDGTTGAVLTNNELEKGIHMTGDVVGHYEHTLSDNSVGGESIYYSFGETDPSPGPGAAQYIFAGATDLDVSGLEPSGAAVGILVAFSDGAKISGTTVSDSTMFHRDDAAAFLLAHSDNAEVTGNTFEDGQADGLVVIDSSGVLVKDNTAQGNDRYGITLLNDSESDVEENVATGNGEAGIAVLDSDGTRLWENTAETNEEVGVLVSGSTDIEVESNTVHDNEETGFLVQGSTGGTFVGNQVTENEAGIVLEGHTGAVLSGNSVTDNRGCSVVPALSPCHGIRIDGSSGIDVLANNLENNHEGIVVEDSSDVVVEGNTLHDNGHTHFGMGVWVIDSPGTVIEDNTATENTKYGFFVERSDNVEVKDNTASDQNVDLVLKESTSVLVEGNTFERGMFLDGDEPAHYLHDIVAGTNTANGGLIVYISGEDAPAMPVDPGQLFVVDSTNLVVDGLEIDAAAVGIQVAYSDEAVIEENKVTNSTFRAVRGYTMTLPAGIVVYGSDDVVVNDNTANDNDRDGIRVTASPQAILERNHVQNNARDGISLRDAPNSEVLDNTLLEQDTSNAGVGVRVSHGSNNVLVQNNTFNDNFEGVLVWFSSDVEVAGNLMEDSWRGVRATGPNNEGSPGLKVYENTINGVTSRAIQILSDSDGAQITNNVLNDVGSTGIYTVRNDDIVIEGNVINGASGSGIQINFHTTSSAPRSNDVVIKGNTIMDTQDEGILIFNVLNDLQVMDNTVKGSDDDGIRLSTSSSFWRNDLHMSGNAFEENDGFGARVFRSEGLLTDNTFRGNAEGGLRLSQSNGLTVSWSTFEDHHAPGIEVDSQSETHIHNNTAMGNQVDLLLEDSTDTKFVDNTLQGGILIEGSSEAHFTAHDLEDSTVNGAPIVLFYDEPDPAVPSDAGQIIIVKAEDLSFSAADLGADIGALLIIDSGDLTVTDVPFGPGLGIIVMGAGDVEVTGSTLDTSTMAGVYVDGADSATVTGNTMTGALHEGVWLRDVTTVLVEENSIDHERGTGVHVESAQAPVIHDNTVEGGGIYGIWVEDANGASVTNNTIHGAGEYGMRMLTAQDSFIANNSANQGRGTGAYLGEFNAQNVEGTHLLNNEFSGNEETGLVVSRSHDVVIEDLTVDDNGAGVELIGFVSGTVLDVSAIRDNDGHGVFGSGIGDLSIKQSVITGNAGNGLNLVQVGGEAEWLIEGNTIRNNENGVFMDASGGFGPRLRGVEVLDNTISQNTGTGVIVEGRPNSDDDVVISDNTIEGNTIGVDYTVDQFGTMPNIDAKDNWWGATTGPSGGQQDPITAAVADGDGDSIASAQGNNVRFDPFVDDLPLDEPFFEVGILSTNDPVDEGETVVVTVNVKNTGQEPGVQTIELRDSDDEVLATDVDLELAVGEEDTITLEWETFVGDWGNHALQVASQDDTASTTVQVHPIDTVLLDACATLDVPGDFALDADLTSSSTCITIATDGVSFDGQGHSITGDDLASGNQFGILVNHPSDRLSGVDVSNVIVENWTFGVQLWETDDSQVTDVEARESGSGFRLLGSNNNQITGLDAHSNDFRGVILSGSHHNEFTDLHVHDNELAGSWSGRGALWFSISGDNEFTNTLVEGGNVGIRISSGLRNTFTDLTVQNTDRYGIEVGSNSNKFYDVTVTGSGQASGTWAGVFVQHANNNHFENIDSSHNSGTGVRFAGSTLGSPVANGNTLVNLTAIGTDPSGVSLSVAHNSVLRNLHLENSAGIGLDFSSRAHNTNVENVTVVAPGASAIHFGPDSQDNSVRDVNVTDSGGPVLDFRSSMSTDTKNNLVEDIFVEGSNVLFVSSWEAEANSVKGMQVDGMDLSFTAQDVTVSLADQQPGLPVGTSSLGMYLDIKEGPTSPLDGYDPRVDEIRFGYTEDHAADVDEVSLALWHHDGNDWHGPDDVDYATGVDLTDRFVFAEGIEDFSVFAVLAEAQDPPEVDIQAVIGHLLEGGVVYSNGALEVEVEVEASAGLESVVMVLDSQDRNFRASQALGQGSAWSGSFDLGAVPDDGDYTLEVTATDVVGLSTTVEFEHTVRIDRVAPTLATVVDSVDTVEEEAVLLIHSDETLAANPVVTVRNQDDEVLLDAVEADPDGDDWRVDFDIGESGVYNITVEGSDLAGNLGIAESEVFLTTDFVIEDDKVAFVNPNTGLFVILELDPDADPTDLYVAFSQNKGAFQALEAGAVGVGFLTGLLGDDLGAAVVRATIGMPADTTGFQGLSPTDVFIQYFDGDAWTDEDVETSYVEAIEEMDFSPDQVTGPYWVANVTGFSTYGALGEDNDPPEITLVEPGDGVTVQPGDTILRFEYEDALSGIDIDSVEVLLDGVDVTSDSATSLSSAVLTHAWVTEVGETYVVNFTVADEAGNLAWKNLTFQAAVPTVGGGGGPGTPADPGTYFGFIWGVQTASLTPGNHMMGWEPGFPLHSVDLSLEADATLTVQIMDPGEFPGLPQGHEATFFGVDLVIESNGPVSGAAEVLIPAEAAADWPRDRLVMMHHDGDGWQALPTAIARDDSEGLVVSFVLPPSFSPFVLAQGTESVDVDPEPEDDSTEPGPEAEPGDVQESDDKDPTGVPWAMILVVVVVLALAALVVWFVVLPNRRADS